jgi:CRP-like cAMP-binding protein
MYKGTGSGDGKSAILHELFEGAETGAARISIRTGALVFDAGCRADRIWLIVEGEIHLRQISANGQVRLIDILGPGDWIGAAALADFPTYAAQAIAASSSVLLEARAENILTLLEQHPKANRIFIHDLVAKLGMARHDSAALVFNDCNHRLIATLLRFSGSAAATPVDEGVALRLTHSQLAQAIGVARETVSLALTNLRHRQLLKTGRNQLIFNPDELRRALRDHAVEDRTGQTRSGEDQPAAGAIPSRPGSSRFGCAPAPWRDTEHDRPAQPAPRRSAAGSA